MQNKLADLNNYLFAQIERLDDESLTEEELGREINRAKALCGIAGAIVSAAHVQIKAIPVAREAGVEIGMPALLLGDGGGRKGER